MTTKTRKPKATREELQRQIRELESQLIHVPHFFEKYLDRASTQHLAGSGVILSLTFLGGKAVADPVCIRGGLSPETITAIKADLARSYEDAAIFKPSGVKL